MRGNAKTLAAVRQLRGRVDFMLFLCKWDREYRKDLLVTLIAFGLLFYSVATIDHWLDYIAILLEASIIGIQLGGELSILPPDYRPAHGGVRYSAQPSGHIAYDELSFAMGDVRADPAEEAAGLRPPRHGPDLARENALASAAIDNRLMLNPAIPCKLEEGETNYIRSRHQIRYIAIRVADRVQHTTNGAKLALYDSAAALLGAAPVVVRKSWYFDALLTAEAFRSRIFRNNMKGEREVYTDLTTYFPALDDAGTLRLLPDLHKRVSGHIGITSLLLTENRRVALLYQGATKAIGARTVSLGGSGSLDFADYDGKDLYATVLNGMSRELAEETGMRDRRADIARQTMITGFFRWVDRCGKPEFTGITRAGDLPFFSGGAIDGDEVVRFEEAPVTVNSPHDFKSVMDYIRAERINLSLSSLMALERLVEISTYDHPQATPAERAVFDKLAAFIA